MMADQEDIRVFTVRDSRGRFVFGRIAEMADAWLCASAYAYEHKTPITVTNHDNGHSVKLDRSGHVIVQHTHGGPYTPSNCFVLNCGRS